MNAEFKVTVKIQKERAMAQGRYGSSSFIETRLYVILPEYKMSFPDYLQDKFGYWTKDLTKFNKKVWGIVENPNMQISEKENTITNMLNSFIS